MPDFDPDAYLKKKAPQFDPDAYLATKAPDVSRETLEQPAPIQPQTESGKNLYQRFQDWQKRTGRDLFGGEGAISESLRESPTARVGAEAGAGIGRTLSSTFDSLVTGPANEVLKLTGASEDQLFEGVQNYLNRTVGMDQPFMKGEGAEGVLRDYVVKPASEIAPAAAGGGMIARGIAGQVPAATAMAPTTTTQGVIQSLGSSTAAQDVGYGALSGAGGEIGEQVGGTPGKIIGSVVAPMAPALVAGSAKRLFTGVGQERQKFVSNVDDYFSAGAEKPSVGQLKESQTVQQLEKVLGSVPSGGPFRRAFDQTSRGIKNRLTNIADDISKTVGEEEAGQAIKRGLGGKGGFVDRFTARSGKLWDAVDNGIGLDTNVSINNVKQTLDDVVRDNALTDKVNNPILRELKQSVQDIDSIDYKSLADFRSLIGRKLGNIELVSDIPKADLKRVYGAITEDIGIAASQAVKKDSSGRAVASIGDKVAADFARANKYTSSGHKRINDFLASVNKKVNMDDVFNAVTRGSEGVKKINSFKRSLTKSEWDVVASNMIRKLGKPPPGSRSADELQNFPDEFSIAQFVTDWNKLGKVKSAAFSGSDKLNTYRNDLDKIAAVAGKLKLAGKEGANPSGTGQSVATLAAGASVFTRDPTVIGSVIGLMGANNIGARLMTNPKFVRWLASNGSKQFKSQVPKLAVIANQSEINDAVAIADFIRLAGSEEDNP